MFQRALSALRGLTFVVFILFCLWMELVHLRESASAWDASQVTGNMANVWEQRMVSVRENLPGGLQFLGYVDDSAVPGATYNVADTGPEYILTQYALSPIIVQRGFDFEWILGSFASGTRFRPYLDENLGEYYEIQNLGNVLYLIHNIEG